MDMHRDEPGFVEIGLTVAAFSICAWAAGGPLIAAITAVLVLAATSRGRPRPSADSYAANDNATLRHVHAMNQPETFDASARSGDGFEGRAAA
jgi:hypothetical protein